MRTTVIAAALAAAALAIPAVASAKEIQQAAVCGASACTTVKDPTLLESFADGGTTRSAPTAAPFYRVTLTIGGEGGQHDSFTTSMVPARNAIRGEDGNWMQLLPEGKQALQKSAAGLTPFPASSLQGAVAASVPAKPAAPAGGDLSWWERAMIGTPILIALGLLAARRARGPWRRPAAG